MNNFNNDKIKIYRDSGADIKYLKPYYGICDFIQYPYDSEHRPKNKKMDLAIPSALFWEDANTTWGEMAFTWNECEGSDICHKIAELVNDKINKADVLHLDSAYKSECHIFLTSDKGDIWNNRSILEQICSFKIFYPKDEQQKIIEYIGYLKSQFGL